MRRKDNSDDEMFGIVLPSLTLVSFLMAFLAFCRLFLYEVTPSTSALWMWVPVPEALGLSTAHLVLLVICLEWVLLLILWWVYGEYSS
jgi:hypothetical protein